jgi:hypothetical protein
VNLRSNLGLLTFVALLGSCGDSEFGLGVSNDQTSIDKAEFRRAVVFDHLSDESSEGVGLIKLRAISKDTGVTQVHELKLVRKRRNSNSTGLFFENKEGESALITISSKFTSVHLKTSRGVFEFNGESFAGDVFSTKGFVGDDFVVGNRQINFSDLSQVRETLSVE